MSVVSLPTASLRSSAAYADLNRKFGLGGEPDLLFDAKAISQAIHNIFSTAPGECGPIFEPEFGSMLPYLLQEPMDQITSYKVRAATIQALQKWEPRIRIDLQNTTIEADYQNQSYKVRIVFTIIKTGEQGNSNLRLSPLTPIVDRPAYSTLEYSINYPPLGWPGILEYAVVDGLTLRYDSIGTWEDAESWTEFLIWGSPSTPFIRFTSVVDRETVAERVLRATFRGESVQTIDTEISLSNDGSTYTPFMPLTTAPMNARYYKVRVTVSSPSPLLTVGTILFFV